MVNERSSVKGGYIVWIMRLQFAAFWLSHALYITGCSLFSLYSIWNLEEEPFRLTYHEEVLLGVVFLLFLFVPFAAPRLQSIITTRWLLVVNNIFALLIFTASGALQNGLTSGVVMLCCCLALGKPLYQKFALTLAKGASLTPMLVTTLMQVGTCLGTVAGLFLAKDMIDEVWLRRDWAIAISDVLQFAALGMLWLAGAPSDSDTYFSTLEEPKGIRQEIKDFLQSPSRYEIFWVFLIWRLLFFALMMVALIAETDHERLSMQHLLGLAWWFAIGYIAGALLATRQPHLRRGLGVLPFAATLCLLGLIFFASSFTDPGWTLPALALAWGNAILGVQWQRRVPESSFLSGMAFRASLDAALVILLSAVALCCYAYFDFSKSAYFWFFVYVIGAATVVFWIVFFREVCEIGVEVFLSPMYRTRGHGPGIAKFPLDGPVLLVANHAAWVDPFWLGLVVPRSLIPMMTSSFYDLPIIKWFMRYVARAIRVLDTKFRREVPEIGEAVKAIDRGETLVLFPEGRLRRHDDKLLHPFGQGIWHILKERPETPIVACWIEGGWGSYCSHKNGPPTKNKKLDFRRPIDIAVNEPVQVPSEIVNDKAATRKFLMEQCLNARTILGLETPQEMVETEIEDTAPPRMADQQ